jgi:hypothetical protein
MAIAAKDVSSTSEQRVASRRYVRVLAISALGAILVWQIITRSLVAYLASASPETALALAPSDPETLLNLVDRELTRRLEAARRTQSSPPSAEHTPVVGTAPDTTDRIAKWAEMGARATGAERLEGGSEAPASDAAASGFHPSDQQMRAWAELALVRDPLNARALRILGQLAAAAGDETSADKFMEAAASRSLHERLPVYYLMQKRLQQKNFAQAVYFADALLRTTPEVLPNLMPALAFMAETPSAAGELKSVLAKNPPWRAGFLAALPSAVSDARTPLDVLLAIKDSSTPPTTGDLRSYLDFLVGKKLYELAYYTWLQFLPVEQLSKVGNLYNARFELDPSGLPFDWAIASGSGVTTEILPRTDADGENALYITFEQGRVEFNGVTQLLMLAPGDYEFKGKFKGELIGPRGLKWRIACAGGSAPLAESAMMIGAHPIWKDIEFFFTVPSVECRAQQLRLDLDARMSSEQLVTGSVWIGELQISRRATAEAGK